MTDAAAADPASALVAFTAVRRRLFGIAYRMLGSVAEAEDVVQDVWIRWQNYDDKASLDSTEAFLVTMATRQSITVATSARGRRETYIGPWLPEPVDTSADPTLGAERAEALETAVLMLLEKLTPTERAAYVLREAFDYPYETIATIVAVSAANARQLVSRARRHLADGRRAPVPAAEHRRLLEAFLEAARNGDIARLETLLAEDVISYSDGGGAVRASKFPVVGRERVAKFFRAFASHFWESVETRIVESNGTEAVELLHGETRVAVVSIGYTDAGITRVFWQMNPAKLHPAP
jgi:RNA polymerase sigma-70 factor (TIGR02957 family)